MKGKSKICSLADKSRPGKHIAGEIFHITAKEGSAHDCFFRYFQKV